MLVQLRTWVMPCRRRRGSDAAEASSPMYRDGATRDMDGAARREPRNEDPRAPRPAAGVAGGAGEVCFDAGMTEMAEISMNSGPSRDFIVRIGGGLRAGKPCGAAENCPRGDGCAKPEKDPTRCFLESAGGTSSSVSDPNEGAEIIGGGVSG